MSLRCPYTNSKHNPNVANHTQKGDNIDDITDDTSTKDEVDDQNHGGSFSDFLNDASDLDESDQEESDEIEEVEDDEVYSWLEDGIPASKRRRVVKGQRKKGEVEVGEVIEDGEVMEEGEVEDGEVMDKEEEPRTEREKTILDDITKDPFDVLPEGWISICHFSGMPIYLHRKLRVCTMTKPYFLGTGSARKHDIPLSAIPCLHYRRALDELEKTKENPSSQENVDSGVCSQENLVSGEVNGVDGVTTSTTADTTPVNQPSAKGTKRDINDKIQKNKTTIISNVADSVNNASLSVDDMYTYCSRLFRFKKINVVRYKSWKDRRLYNKQQNLLNRPTMPENTKLITCNIRKDASGRENKKQFVFNPAGKSVICILHEYCQHALQLQPKYNYDEHENSLKPYSATVHLGDATYATGYGGSKKLAKAEAAKMTLSILIPDMNAYFNEKSNDPIDLTYFDEIRIEDPRAVDLCHKTGQPVPYQLLLECLKRNFGIHDSQIQTKYSVIKNQKHELTMTVDKHEATYTETEPSSDVQYSVIINQKYELNMMVDKHEPTVLCRNKREGKQLASQTILQLLHPHLETLGSVLRMYGRAHIDRDEKRNEEQEITGLQQPKRSNKPNTAVLDKLRDEMIKLWEIKTGKTKERPIKPLSADQTNEETETVHDHDHEHTNNPEIKVKITKTFEHTIKSPDKNKACENSHRHHPEHIRELRNDNVPQRKNTCDKKSHDHPHGHDHGNINNRKRKYGPNKNSTDCPSRYRHNNARFDKNNHRNSEGKNDDRKNRHGDKHSHDRKHEPHAHGSKNASNRNTPDRKNYRKDARDGEKRRDKNNLDRKISEDTNIDDCVANPDENMCDDKNPNAYKNSRVGNSGSDSSSYENISSQENDSEFIMDGENENNQENKKDHENKIDHEIYGENE